MSSLNKIIIIGHVGKDPESRFMPNGDAVVNFSVATSEKWTGKNGEKHEETEWHNCVAFRKLADVINEWVRKGSLVYVEGRIKTEKWTDKDGIERYSTKVYADRLQMLGKRADSDTQKTAQQTSAPKDRGESGFDDLDSDITF